MNIRRQNMRQLSCFIALVFIVFALCSTFASLLYSPSGDLLLVLGMPGSIANTQESMSPIKNQFYLSVLPVSEAFYRTINNLATSRQMQRFLYSSINTQSSLFICTSLLTFSSLTLFKKTDRHTSVIALPIGGHAPPKI